MSQHSINDLESHNDLESQCSLLKSAQVYEQELAYGGVVKGKDKARKVAFGAGALALIALVVFGGVFYFGETEENATNSATTNDSETASNNPSATVELPTSDEHGVVDGEAPEGAEEGLACWQWGLIGTGAYVASNVLCAAFACSIYSCRIDSTVDYMFREKNGLLSVAEYESKLKEDYPEFMKEFEAKSEEDKNASREQYAKELAAKQAEFEAPGCCVLCQSMLEITMKMEGKTDVNIAAVRAEAEKEGKLEEFEKMGRSFCCTNCSDIVPKFAGIPSVCRGFVYTALWNFLTLNLCSIMPCIFPANAEEGKDSCLFKEDSCGSCLTECYLCECCTICSSVRMLSSSQQEESSSGCCGGNKEDEGEDEGESHDNQNFQLHQ